MEMEQEHRKDSILNKDIEMKQKRHKEVMILTNKEIDMEQERHKADMILKNTKIQVKQKRHREDILKNTTIQVKQKRHREDMILKNNEIEASTRLAKEQSKNSNWIWMRNFAYWGSNNALREL